MVDGGILDRDVNMSADSLQQSPNLVLSSGTDSRGGLCEHGRNKSS